VTLDDAPLGESALVAATDVDPSLGRRLAELGIRAGQHVTPLHRTSGGGRVLAVGDTRLALARTVLRRIQVSAS
jgi:Fe2+ transport system protein FeoA